MAGGLFGGLIEEAILGRKKPKVPNAPNVNPQTAQKDSIAGNQAALPGLENLASDVNQFNVDQRRSMLGSDYWKLRNQGDDVLGNWLSGNLSPDVASAVRRNSNAKAFAGGYGGSGMGDNLQARDLGLTSLDLQKMGQATLPGFLNTTTGIEQPRQFDPIFGFISPGQQIGVQQWNEENRFSRDWLNNQIKALPDPFMAALANTVGNIADPTSGALSLIGDVYGGSGGGSGAASSLAADYGGEMAAGGGGAAASGGGY